VKDEDTMHRLARSIVETGGREGVEALLGLLEEGGASGHRLHPLCGSIAEAGAPEDAEKLFGLLERTGHPDGARALLKAAVSLSGDEGLDRCLGLLAGSNEGDVRAAAADVIARLDPSGHVPQLVEALGREEFGRTQWHLTQALARAGEAGMTQLTEFLAEDRNEHRKHEILSSLSHLDEGDASSVLASVLLRDDQPRIREHAAEILAKIANNNALAALTRALEQEADADVRERVAEHLSRARERRGGGG
jgi:HEAT repeat protein